MQLTVTLTPKEQRKIAAIINRPHNGPLAFWRFVVLAVALAPPLYTFILYIGDVATSTVLRAVFGYPLLYVGIVLFLLLNPPVLRLLGYNGARRVGGRVLNGEEHSYQFDTASFTRSQNGRVVSAYTFSAVGEVRRTGGFILLMQGTLLLAALPERCFAGKQEAGAADAALRNSVAYSRGGFAQPLNVAYGDCMWRFQYMVDAGLGIAANTVLRQGKAVKGNAKKAGWTVFMVLMLLAVCGVTAFFVLYPIYAESYWLFYLIWAPAFGVLAAHNPTKPGVGPALPSYTYGPTTMEITADGLRVWAQQYEEAYTWRDLTAVLPGNGFGLVLRGANAAAALPYNVAPPEVVQPALQHITNGINRAAGPVPVAPEPAPPTEPTL